MSKYSSNESVPRRIASKKFTTGSFQQGWNSPGGIFRVGGFFTGLTLNVRNFFWRREFYIDRGPDFPGLFEKISEMKFK